jgi:hypothetical protein
MQFDTTLPTGGDIFVENRVNFGQDKRQFVLGAFARLTPI